jgi:hypothetical protein
MRSQANMTWNKMPHHHIKKLIFFSESWSRGIFFSWHGMKNLHVVNLFFSLRFCQKQILTSFIMTYMFIVGIYTRCINAHIHQGLNLRPHGSTISIS